MFDENEHLHPQNNDEGPRHIHRGIKRSEPDEVEVDSADFFSPSLPGPKAPPKPAPTPPSDPPKPPVPPRRQWEPLHPSEPAPADDKLPKGGMVLLVLQAILSLAALVQLWRTQMLPGALPRYHHRASGAALAAGAQVPHLPQRCRRGPGAVRPALRRAGRGLCLGAAGPDRTGQHDFRPAHRRRRRIRSRKSPSSSTSAAWTTAAS